MSAAPTQTELLDLQDERLFREQGFRATIRSTITRARGGDLGSLPVVAGLVLIAIIFQSLNRYFLSSANLVDLLTDSAAIGVISLGIVLVLLLGEIDLSVGSMSGLASAILGVTLTVHGWPLLVALGVALTAGVAVGALYGYVFTRFSVPSFVITLAGLLSLLGIQLKVLGVNGSINIPFSNPLVSFSQQSYVARPISYVLVALVAVGYFAVKVRLAARRRAANLSSGTVRGAAVTAVILLVALELATWYLNRDRGISGPFVLFTVLVLLLHFALVRTQWGRSVYAVGGSVEAARRAGINVRRVYISVFILCSTLAALGGLLSAGRLATASIGSGTGDTNLNAIAAAVIGGTSLFGGRGRAASALLGMLVIQSISSGLTLLSLDASVRYVITGAVLLAAVIVDSLARRSRAAHGRA